MMLQPPRGRAVSFYEWEGRREGKGRHCAGASALSSSLPTDRPPPSSLSLSPPYFLNGRAGRLGGVRGRRRKRAVGWGGGGVLKCGGYIFMNGEDSECECAGAAARFL